jgi:hypothetical protein
LALARIVSISLSTVQSASPTQKAIGICSA